MCLATSLLKHGDIQVDVYEVSNKFEEVGAGLTLWGRVCEALRLMDLANDCMNASVIAASASGLPASMSPLISSSIPVTRVYQQLASTCVASSSQTETLAVSRLRVSSRPGFPPVTLFHLYSRCMELASLRLAADSPPRRPLSEHPSWEETQEICSNQ